MPDLSLRQIPFHSDLVSKPVRDNFTDTENAINNLQDQIDLLTTTPGGTEVTNARDYHTVLRDRLRSDSLGRGNVLVSGGLVTAQGSPNMTVAVSAGEAVIGGIACKWTSQNSGTITAPTTGRYDVVVINSDNTLSILSGNDSADKVLPDVSSTQKALAVITLASSTTSITNSLIRDCSEQGCHANGHYFWKIQDAVDSLNDRTNELDEGEIVIHKGNYYEEVILTAFSNVTLRYDGGARHYRPSATGRCIKSINTAGNEETFIKIIGGQFYGNGKSGAIENLRFEYTDKIFIQNIYSNGNSSSSATYKDILLSNCDDYSLLNSIFISNGYTGSTKLLNELESKRTVLKLRGIPSQVGDLRVWPTIEYDNRSIYNGTTGEITLPYDGWYKIRFIERMRFNSGAGQIIILVNGVNEFSASGFTDGRTVLLTQTETDQGAAYEYYIGEIIVEQSANDVIGVSRVNAPPDNDGLLLGSLYVEFMQNMDSYWDN